MESRNQIFPRLKPLCVALHQAALEINGPKANVDVLAQRLEDLKHALSSIVSKPNSLDERIAEYVFVPLSYVLKASQRVSLRCLELTFQCLAILIDQGWKSRIQPQLAAQVVILCTLMAEKQPKGIASAESTPELQASALWCLFHTFSSAGSADGVKASLNSEPNFPQLGQTISVVLDAMVDGESIETQIAAMNALRSLVQHVATKEVQAAFVPGIVSKLTRILTPQTKQRRNHTVLVGSLETIQLLLQNTLSDQRASTIDADSTELKNANDQHKSTAVDKKWLQNAATQLKPALANITRLREHSRSDVKEALSQLCVMILKQCRTTLATCAELALETILLLAADDSDGPLKFRLESLMYGDASISDLLQNTLYDWLQSLPTKMQAVDAQSKLKRVGQISTAYGILKASSVDTNTLDRMMANVLRDSMVITLQSPGVVKQDVAAQISPLYSLDLAVAQDSHRNTDFTSSLVKHKGQQDVIQAISQFAVSISTLSAKSFAADLARSVRQSYEEQQIASFWLLLDVTKAQLKGRSNVDAFLDFDDRYLEIHSHHLEELYSLSLEVLSNTSDEPPDYRLQALALRTLALRAHTLGKEFRYELVDALYPVLHALATPDEMLQQDSITTLNVYTAACGYVDVKDLIVDNVDYLTNAVALKLNAFDVSPQAPQVLLMMVRLAGPSLLPYLEDTIDSIFTALEDFHGYPLLVELLFRILSVVAEEGAKAPQLAIEDGGSERPAVRSDWQPMTIADVVASLRDRAKHPLPSDKIEEEPHPQRPWKTIEDADRDEDEDGRDEDQLQPTDEPEKPPPAPKTYSLLLKISELTQHFLPSASPTLRASLLALLKTTIPAVARHENSFLPLINTLWPEITSRLDDTETYITANALDLVAMLCDYAGDFMRTRILQFWPRLVETYHQTVKDIIHIAAPAKISQVNRLDFASTALTTSSLQLKQAVRRMRSSPADYSDTGTRLVWTSLIRTITAAIRHVELSPELFEEALDMAAPVLDEPVVLEAFESRNADMVWLIRLRTGTVDIPKLPKMAGSLAVQFALVNG